MKAALPILSRAAAATGGGYALAALVAAAWAVAGPGARADAVVVGMMLGLLVQAGAAIWAFGARSARRAWAGLLGGAVLPGTVVLWHGWTSGAPA